MPALLASSPNCREMFSFAATDTKNEWCITQNPAPPIVRAFLRGILG